MPESLLTILKFLLLILVYLFFFRVLRAVWAEVTPATSRPAAAGAGATLPPRNRATDERGSKAARLKVIEPAEQRGHVYPLGEEVTVGRAAGCQVHLDDTFASQLHARVYRKNAQLFVEDLGSTNGTYLTRKGTSSREKVNGAVVLRPGDRILIGKTVLEVSR